MGLAGSLSLDSIRITQEGLENLHNNWIIGRCSALSACYCEQYYSSCEWMNESELKHLPVWPSLGYFFLSALICLHTVGKQDQQKQSIIIVKKALKTLQCISPLYLCEQLFVLGSFCFSVNCIWRKNKPH